MSFVNRSARHLILPLVGLGAILAGCGSSGPATISASTATTLHRDVQQIRAAADGGDTTGARAAVTALRTDVARFASRGQLASADAAVLLVDANQITGRIGAAHTQATPPASTTPANTTPASPQKTPPGKAKGHGNGHGRGNDGGGGGGGGGDGGGD